MSFTSQRQKVLDSNTQAANQKLKEFERNAVGSLQQYNIEKYKDTALNFLYEDLIESQTNFDFKRALGNSTYYTSNNFAFDCLDISLHAKTIYNRKIPQWTKTALHCFDCIIVYYVSNILNETIPTNVGREKETEVYNYLISKGGNHSEIGTKFRSIYNVRNSFEHIHYTDQDGKRQVRPLTNKELNRAKDLILNFFREALNHLLNFYKVSKPIEKLMDNKIANFFTDTLTGDQKRSLEKIELFLASNSNCFLLKGYAGTGKTFLMQGLVKYFQLSGRQFALMAPTGRAAMVIGDKTKTDAYTIHKSIYNLAVLEDDDHTFKFRYKLNLNENSINTVYIIDESSMISDVYNEDEFFVFGSGYLLKDLFSFVDFKYRTDSKIIFIGDNAQLPPVGMNFSPALDKEYLQQNYLVTTDEYEMKQIHRQEEESGILKIATSLRNGLEINEYNRFEIVNSKDTSTCLSEEFESLYFTKINNTITDDTIVITHSNKQAHDYNLAIRQRFFPNILDVQKGDVLINTKNNYNYVVDFYNGQFLKVIDASSTPEPQKTIRFYKRGGEKAEVTFMFRDIIAELSDVKGQKHQVNCKIIDNFLKSDQPRLTQNEQQGLYVDFKNRHPNLKPRTREFYEALKSDKYFNAMQVKYGYAITCHKAQGGEWDNAFVNFEVYMKILSKGFFRWSYTAVTRAKKTLYAINVRNYSPLSEYIIQPTASISNTPPNQFHIPSDFFEREIPIEFSQPYLKAKYIEVSEKLRDQDIVISIIHLQWVERYTFSRGKDSVTIDLNYGGNGFTGGNKIINLSDQDFAQFIRQKITEPLIFEFVYDAPTGFQKELYEMLVEETFEVGVPITNIVNENYFDRYFLLTDAKCAYLDCTYNRKGIYTQIKGYSTKGEQDLKLESLIKRLS